MPITQTAAVAVYNESGSLISQSPFYWGIKKIQLLRDGRIAKMILTDATAQPHIFSWIVTNKENYYFQGVSFRSSPGTIFLRVGQTKTVDWENLIEFSESFIAENAQIIIKNAAGTKLAESDFHATIGGLKLTATDRTAALTMLTNDGQETISWQTDGAGSTILSGLTMEAGGTVNLISVGEEKIIPAITTVQSLFERFISDPQPIGSVKLTLYNFTGEARKVDKTAELIPIKTFNIIFKGELDKVDPVIILDLPGTEVLPQFNYAAITQFGRYYFVRRMYIPRTGRHVIELHEDVLMTYAGRIRNAIAFIDRQEHRFNPMLADSMLPLRVNNQRIIKEFRHDPDTPKFTTDQADGLLFQYALVIYKGAYSRGGEQV